jgi:hypothetical protein
VAQVTAEEESVQIDAYLSDLLTGRFAGPRRVRAEDDVDPEMEATAALVQRALARFHPSFAFEERLSARLQARARAAGGTPADDRSEPVALATRMAGGGMEHHRARPARLSNGAIASGVSIAGVSIAGAALLVRRRARPASHRRTGITV